MALPCSILVLNSKSFYLEVFLQESKLVLDSQRKRDVAAKGSASPVDYSVQ